MRTLREVLEMVKNEDTKGILFVDDFGNEKKITYSKMYNDAIDLLNYFMEKGIVPGDKVLMQIEEDITYVRTLWACILGGIVAVPLDIAANEEKKAQLLKICNMLGNVFIVKDNNEEDSYTSAIQCIDISNKLQKKWGNNKLILNVEIKEDDAVFYMFTSGSTGTPKGVILTNKNMVSNLCAISKHYEIKKNVDCSLSWMPFSHVLGLVPGLFVSIYACIDQVKLSLNYYLLDPVEWLVKASKHKVTLLYTTNFGLKQVLKRVRDNNNLFDLSLVRMICVTAEPISSDMCYQFEETFAEYGLKGSALVPTYGMTEATGHITSKKIGEIINKKYILASSLEIGAKIEETDEGVEVISCGMPVEGCDIRICDEKNEGLKEKVFGNIQISGTAVVEKILNCDMGMTKCSTWYPTGDTGFIYDGELYVVGRSNDIIIINGCNYYPKDIERIIEEIPEMNNIEFSIASVQKPDKSEGVGLFIKESDINIDNIKIKIKSHVNEKIGVDIWKFIVLGEMPKTKSGKIKRGELRKLVCQSNQFEDIDNNEICNVEFDDTNMIRTIKDIFSDVLQMPITSTDINFFSYGINSLKLMEISIKIKKAFNVKMDIGVLYKKKTIDELAREIIFRCENSNYILRPMKFEVESGKNSAPFELTEIQQAYMVGRSNAMVLGNCSTQVYFQIKTKIDIERLNTALNRLILKHESLRTVIEEDYQIVLSQVPQYQMEIIDLTESCFAEKKDKLVSEREKLESKIFAPNNWPLFEIKAVKMEDTCFYLLVKLDMLILDASSIDIFAKELFQIYSKNDKGKVENRHTFRQYIEAYKKVRETDVYEMDRKYWMEKLDSFPEAPVLPMKVDVSSIHTPHFKRQQYTINKSQWESLNKISKAWNVTTSNILCAIYIKMLSVWSNQERLGISITSSNRYPVFEDVNTIMGDFTSIIPFAANTNTEKLFENWVAEIQDQLFEGLEHCTYDGVTFLRELAKSKQQFTEAMLPIVFTSMIESNHNNWKLFGEIEECITRTPQVLLDCQLSEFNGNLHIAWDYVDEYFDEYIIESMFEQYIELIQKLISNNDLSFADFGATEKEYNFIQKYNTSDDSYEIYPLHVMFEREAKRNPNHVAVISNGTEMTYYELDFKSNQVANKLIEQGIQKNDMVGVIGVRCKETIANILGILKAGACYIPIDPDYPKERVDYIVKKSGCKTIIEPKDVMDDVLKQYSSEKPKRVVELDDLAYVIFTSGSTGHPKGVVITHREAANTIIDINRKFNISDCDRILGISSMCFDLSVFDIFGTFSAGATLIQIKDQRDVQEIYDSLRRYKITVWNSVPAIMEMMIQYINDNLMSNSCESEMTRTDETKYYSSVKFEKKNEENNIYCEYEEMLNFLCNGRTIDEIQNKYQEYTEKEVEELLKRLQYLKLVQKGISNPFDVFEGQERFIDNPYGEEILCNPDCYEAFKEKQLNRRVIEVDEKIFINPRNELPQYISERSSIRCFDRNRQIERCKFEELLSSLRQRKVDGEIKYYYPSAGGLYPLDIYVWIKENAVEGMKQGLYYYCPMDNSLNYIFKDELLTDEIQYYSNKNIFNTSSMSVYIVYNAQVTMPKYGSDAYFYACIDAGIVTQLITIAAELLGLSVCSIGKVDVCKMHEYLKLSSSQCLLHSIEVGYKKELKNGTDNLLENSENKKVLTETFKTDNPDLRLVMLSGDWIPLNLPKKIKRIFSNSKIISLGGATEAAIWSIYYPVIEVAEEWKSIPYGFPLANQKFYVLDENRNLCHIDSIGELYIGGIGVANGYLNDVEKTKNAFIEHPIFGRLYKTGDFGKMKKQGYIEFCGRKDSQVKINGYRIELGEIESCIESFPGIKKVAVIDCADKRNKKFLAAYLVAEGKISREELKDYISGILPRYMIPNYYTFVDRIPLSFNGKVDKSSLPDPISESEKEIKEIIKSEVKDMYEEQIVSVWKEVLGIQEVSLDENFFDVGGTSMLLLQVYGKLNKIYPNIFKITDLFSNTTIQKLACFIRNKKMNDKSVYAEVISINDRSFFEVNVEETSTNNYHSKIDTTKGIYSIVSKLNISSNDFMLAMFLFTLNQELKEDRIGVTELQNEYFRKIAADFSVLDTVEKLCNVIGSFEDYHSLSELIVNKSRENQISIACIDSEHFSATIPKNFDLVLTWKIDTVITLEIIFDNKRYSSFRIKELFNDYIKVLCAYLQ